VIAYTPECPHAVDWTATAASDGPERDLLIYRAATEVAAQLARVPGWRVERQGVAVQVWIGPDRQRHRAPDYTIWTEDCVDQHLHKSIANATRRELEPADAEG
jgi:hypothetical protein